MADFNTALAIWLQVEGAYSSDAGGTQSGITQPIYDTWRRKHSLAPQSVTQIKPTEVSQLLQEDFWQPFNCGALPQAWANFLLVEGGNLPWRAAARIMQNALAWLGYYGGEIDGEVGPVTIAAAKLASGRVDVAIQGCLGHYAVNGDITEQAGFRRRLAMLRQACLETEAK